MRIVTDVKYLEGYKLAITFNDKVTKIVDLSEHLAGEIFKPLKKISYFKTVHLDRDLDTIVWDNGADISPDFLYKIGNNVESTSRSLYPRKQRKSLHEPSLLLKTSKRSSGKCPLEEA